MPSIFTLGPAAVYFLAFSVASSRSLPSGNDPQPEKLPPPQGAMVQPFVIDPVFMEFPHRKSHYAVWDLYGVDRTGHFRPRVIYAPSGAYYLYNGEPYPWVTTHEREIMPYVVD
jgi:hypothetical protein